jgi:hypothetical protein
MIQLVNKRVQYASGRLRRIDEPAERRDLAVANGKNVAPLAGDLFSRLFHDLLEHAEHKNLVAGHVKLARGEIPEIVPLEHESKKALDLGWALPLPEGWKVLPAL